MVTTTTTSPLSSSTTPVLAPLQNICPLVLAYPPSSPSKRPRPRAVAVEALIEDIAEHNASFGRTAAPDFSAPLPSPSKILAAPIRDASLVCAAYYLTLLDTRLAVSFENAAALLVGCLGAGALDAERGAAGKAVECVAKAAGIGCGEVWAYAQIVKTYVPKAVSVAEYRVYDELLRGMFKGLVD